MVLLSITIGKEFIQSKSTLGTKPKINLCMPYIQEARNYSCNKLDYLQEILNEGRYTLGTLQTK